MSARVALVGAGPGDPGLLTVKAARLLREADVLIYDALASSPIVALAGAACEKIYVGKRARMHTLPQEEISRLIVAHAQAGKRVVRLKGGDPFVFGRGGEEAQELRAAGIPFEIVPGISSALAAPAYAGIPVTHRSFNTNFTIATGHEDPTKGASTLDWARLADGHGTSVFLMAMGHLRGITAQLQKFGRAAQTPVAVISDGTTPRQRTVVATLETIADEVERANIGAPAIVVVGDVVSVRDDVRWFDQQPLFGHGVLITRPAEDTAELAQALWELGAQPYLAPTVERQPPTDVSAFELFVDRWVGGATADWLVFTSRHGVRSWFAALQRRQRDARVLGGVRIAAIGRATAAELELNGIRADVEAGESHSEGLERALMPELHDGRPQRLVLCTAENGRDYEWPALRAAGHQVERIFAYRTIPVQAPALADAAHAADLWTFASGSAVKGLLAALPDAVAASRTKQIVSMGPVTTGVLEQCGFTVAATALTPSLTGILAALSAAIERSDVTAAIV